VKTEQCEMWCAWVVRTGGGGVRQYYEGHSGTSLVGRRRTFR